MRRIIIIVSLFLILLVKLFGASGDIILKLETDDGSSALYIEDSSGVKVSSITSDGDAYYAKDVEVAGALDVDGVITLNNDVTSTGNLTVSTITATGDNYLLKDTYIEGDVIVSTIDSSGNTYLLKDIDMVGRILPNGAAGSDGQVLTTYTSSMTWTTIPSGKWVGDTNIYYDSGNVGIGTASTDNPFHVYNAYDEVARFQGDDHVGIILDGTDSSEKSLTIQEGSSEKWKIGMDNLPAGTQDDFIIKQTNNTDAEFTIKTSGYIGIGITDPTGQLHVISPDDGGMKLDSSSGGIDESVYLEFQGGRGTIGFSDIGLTGFNEFVMRTSNKHIILNTDNSSLDNYIYINGTTGDYIDFGTGGSSKMFLNSSGRLGIGTNSPSYNLQIGHATDTGTNTIAIVTDNGTSDIPKLLLTRTGTEAGFIGMGTKGLGIGVQGTGSDPDTQGTLFIDRVTESDVRVGIGTNIPASKLHVRHDISGTGTIARFYDPSMTASDAVRIALGTAASTYNSAEMSFKNVGVSSPSNYLSLGLYGLTETLMVTGQARVGIGKTNPTVKLEVSGRIKDKTGYVMPVGTVVPYAGSTAPSGWLFCDGGSHSTSTYADLYAVIGTTYGSGSGTFNVPNLDGRVPVGLGTGTFNALNNTGGSETHTLTQSEMPSHTHGVPAITLHSDADGFGTEYAQWTGSGATTGSTGSGSAHNNLQPYITLNYIIKY